MIFFSCSGYLRDLHSSPTQRSSDLPFCHGHGQIVGRLVYERMAAPPDELYGEGIGSSYQTQGLALSKHFKAFTPGRQ